MNRPPISSRSSHSLSLGEGNPIHSTERLVDMDRDTVMRLMVEVGEGCARIMGAPDHRQIALAM